MSSDNAKLGRLRDWLRGSGRECPEAGIRWSSMDLKPRDDNCGNLTAWFVREAVIEQIDRMLAEPEPATGAERRLGEEVARLYGQSRERP